MKVYLKPGRPRAFNQPLDVGEGWLGISRRWQVLTDEPDKGAEFTDRLLACLADLREGLPGSILTKTTGSLSQRQPADSLTEAARGGREDPPGRINRSNMLIGVGAVCAVLGMVSLVTQQIWSIVAGEVIEFHTPILGRILYASQITLFVVAVVGLYLHQRKAFNTFGQIATLVALWGSLLWSGSATSEAFMTVANGGKPIDHVPPSLLAWVFVAFGLYVLGLFLSASPPGVPVCFHMSLPR